MRRSHDLEILEHRTVPESEVARVYRDLTRIHRWLGDTAAVVSAVRRDPLPVRRILDVGCGRGGVLKEMLAHLSADLVGVDLKPHVDADAPFTIVQADAVSDPLPSADVAFSMCLGHHLSEGDLVRLIRNVGRSCRRFILLDLVRHRLPLALFSLFVAPFVSPIAASDGQMSIRRAYTPFELTGIAREALAGSNARYLHSIAPLYMRQTLDIRYHGD
jgi:SAM-dependent methyltransferase